MKIKSGLENRMETSREGRKSSVGEWNNLYNLEGSFWTFQI